MATGTDLQRHLQEHLSTTAPMVAETIDRITIMDAKAVMALPNGRA